MSVDNNSFLAQDSFFSVKKSLLRYLEGDAVQAVVLTDLIWLASCFKETDQMKYNNGWFFRSVADVEQDTGINYHKQKVALEKLEEKGFIETRIAGNPAKRHFKLHLKVIENAVYDEVLTSKEEVVTEVATETTTEEPKAE